MKIFCFFLIVLSLILLIVGQNVLHSKNNICGDDAICAYGFYGDNVERNVAHHKLSR